ncbi:hypothetical protein [Oceanithermus sp.]|nr:hypothetical protein [Oceanithermus sp.]
MRGEAGRERLLILPDDHEEVELELDPLQQPPFVDALPRSRL